jgi:hypothetical protein
MMIEKKGCEERWQLAKGNRNLKQYLPRGDVGDIISIMWQALKAFLAYLHRIFKTA